jgi:peptide deformylase
VGVRPIMVRDVPVLHQKAKRVSQFDRNLRALVDDMIDTMRTAPGVGLAAPQVGVPLRVAVIEVDEKVTVLVNPEIVKKSGEEELDEGCLSVPGYWGRIKRAQSVTVKARDQFGKEIRVKGEGLFAQALQHEIDHLNGILYIDHPGVWETRQQVPPRRAHEPEPAKGEVAPVGPEEHR